MIPLFDANWAVIDCKPRASGDDPSMQTVTKTMTA